MMDVYVKEDASFFHKISKQLNIAAPIKCYLPFLENMRGYEPIVSLEKNNIENQVKHENGIYIILLWFPWEKKLHPIYVGSCTDLNIRLVTHNYWLNKYWGDNKNTTDIRDGKVPKYFYELVSNIPSGYWMVTWSYCSEEIYIENELYHVLNDTNYLVNAKASIKDSRSYRKNQHLIAEKRTNDILDLFYLYGSLYKKRSLDW